MTSRVKLPIPGWISAADPLSSPVLHRLLRDEADVFHTQAAGRKPNS
jgi:hypothetical protein